MKLRAGLKFHFCGSLVSVISEKCLLFQWFFTDFMALTLTWLEMVNISSVASELGQDEDQLFWKLLFSYEPNSKHWIHIQFQKWCHKAWNWFHDPPFYPTPKMSTPSLFSTNMLSSIRETGLFTRPSLTAFWTLEKGLRRLLTLESIALQGNYP